MYVFEVRGIPFYVGEGRSSRASDRVRFVRYLVGRVAAGKPVKWVFSNRVVAEFLKRGEKVEVVYRRQGMTRKEAQKLEREEISRLRSLGFMLANQQHNNGVSASVEEIVWAALARPSASASKPFRPEPSRVSPIEQAIKPVPSRFVPDASRGSLTESKILGQPFYNAVVVATGKTARPGDFFHLLQEKAAKPIVLRILIKLLIKMYRPPLSKKDPEMVIRVRARDALKPKLGYLSLALTSTARFRRVRHPHACESEIISQECDMEQMKGKIRVIQDKNIPSGMN